MFSNLFFGPFSIPKLLIPVKLTIFSILLFRGINIFHLSICIINYKAMKSFANLEDRIFEEYQEHDKSKIQVQRPGQRQQQSFDDLYEGEQTQKYKRIRSDKNKKRKNSSYSKWNEEDKKNFWLKNLEEMNKFPEKIHSWNHWKPDRYFHDMAKFLQTKSSSQCKSFDQRMKNQYFLAGKNEIDLPQATIISLSPYANENGELRQKLSILKERIEGKLDLGNQKRNVEENSMNLETPETTQLRNLKCEYMRAVKQCVDYYRGEGNEKLNQLKKIIYS